jgi:hypothetical protein
LGGQALSAGIPYPSSVCGDTVGTLYITSITLVTKIDTSGVISSFAGTGAVGNTGDNGRATSAKLTDPRICVLDTSNNVYIGDYASYVIRMVTLSTKIISRYAGNGVNTAGGPGDGGPATSASVRTPSIFMDTLGNLYATQLQGYRVRKIAADTKIITNFAGSPSSVGLVTGLGGFATSATLSGSTQRIIADQHGNLLIGAGNRLFRVDGATNFVTLHAGQFTPLPFPFFQFLHHLFRGCYFWKCKRCMHFCHI